MREIPPIYPREDDNAKKKEKIYDRRQFLKKSVKLAMGLGAVSALGPLAPKVFGETAPSKEKERTEKEIQQARNILLTGDPERFLENRFVVSALYYSQNFLTKGIYSDLKDPTRMVVAAIKDLITPELRKKYIDYLSKIYIESSPPRVVPKVSLPLKRMNFGTGKNHLDAIDLFTSEGAPVSAMTDGVVALAENGWKKEDRLSTVSYRGGNTVILFSFAKKDFYRYCHLASTPLKAGDFVSAGDSIGIVGHSGMNASLPGHGGHLHLENNKLDPESGNMFFTSSSELKGRILKIEQQYLASNK
ncbi:MAG: M23 family metallopeptidase [Patescibacteria group bacterium]|jgi:murein DD-endopeptidase MepM/ murein hydrolase activator NlpD